MYNEFTKCHPFVNFFCFLFAITVTVLFNHPIITAVSFAGAMIYGITLSGSKMLKYFFIFVLPLCLLCGIFNPVFNHQGMTILLYFQDGNPLTLESVVYGGVSALLLASVLLWFVSFNQVMDSDKIIYLFGRAVPSLATVITMVMRLVPMYVCHFKEVYRLRALEINSFNVLKKIRISLASVSSTTTWALENAVFTADSMTARGYGSSKRSFYSDFVFTKRDFILLSFMILAAVVFSVSAVMGGGYAMYFPYIKMGDNHFFNISAYISFGSVCFMPVFFNVWEELKWRFLR